MSGQHLSDDQAIELVELLVVAVELCATAQSFTSLALSRLGGINTDGQVGELHHDVSRLACMLSGLLSPPAPITRTIR